MVRHAGEKKNDYEGVSFSFGGERSALVVANAEGNSGMTAEE